MATVGFKEIYKIYPKNVIAVNNFNLEIQDKEFIVLVGPSGCGKSTTLRMVAGLEEISQGEIRIDQRIVNDVPPKDRDIAMVFQNYALYPHMTVYENMAFGLKLRKFPKEEIKLRVNEAARILSLEDYLERKPKELSGGQRQRVAVGRAIVRHPKVFLFDEPLSNLDAKLRVQMRTEISRLHHQLQTTMIYVTHDQTEAMTMGDRIVVMKDGNIQQIDSPIRLYNYPVNLFVAGFMGSPAMNFIAGHIIRQDGLRFISSNNPQFLLDLKKFPYQDKIQPYIDQDVIMGIRPEDIFDYEHTENTPDQTTAVMAEIDVVEPMGHEVFLYLNFKLEHSILCRVNTRHIPAVGDTITIGFTTEKIHFFSSDTLETILFKS